MENNLNDAKIAGAGIISGGEYNKVAVSGSGKATGNIKCESFSSAGSFRALGDIECAGRLGASGAFKSDGFVSGDLISVAGAFKAVKGVKGKTIKLAGAIKTEGDLLGENVSISGSVHVDGLLSADTLEIKFGDDKCFAMTVGGGRVKIAYGKGNVRRFFFIKRCGEFESNLIEADEVKLEGVHADTVRAVNAVIGKDCIIGTLEYSGDAKIDDSARVENLVKV